MASYYVTTTGNDTTGDGSSGNPWATPGKAGGSLSTDDTLFIAQGTYTLTNSTPNTAGGPLSLPTNAACLVIGHATGSTTDYSATPVIDAGAQTGVSLIAMDGADGENQVVFNVDFDGQQGANNFGINGTSNNFEMAIGCSAIDCATGFDNIAAHGCKSSYVGSETGTGFNICRCTACWADNHNLGFSGATNYSACIASDCSEGWDDQTGYRCIVNNCVAYSCTNAGFAFRNLATFSGILFLNCISYGNGTYGYQLQLAAGTGLINCASGSNSSGRSDSFGFDINAITLTADPFVDGANGDFRLNNAPGGGALCREAGIAIVGHSTHIGAVPLETTAPFFIRSSNSLLTR